MVALREELKQFIKNTLGANVNKQFYDDLFPLIDEFEKQTQRYQNLKTQCYYKLADKINTAQIGVDCTDINIKNNLIEELEQVRTKDADKDNKLQIIPKDNIKAILGRSPDYADAMAMRMFYEIDSNYGRYYVQ